MPGNGVGDRWTQAHPAGGVGGHGEADVKLPPKRLGVGYPKLVKAHVLGQLGAGPQFFQVAGNNGHSEIHGWLPHGLVNVQEAI